MFNNSFNFRLFIINIIFNSLKKIFRFLILINTEVIDITFIDESLILKLCKCFDIQSILLSKSKLIQLYDETFD